MLVFVQPFDFEATSDVLWKSINTLHRLEPSSMCATSGLLIATSELLLLGSFGQVVVGRSS